MSYWPEPPTPPSEADWPEPPTWNSPPTNELGVAIPAQLAVVRTTDCAVVVRSLVAYSEGLELTLSVRLRRPLRGIDPIHGAHAWRESILSTPDWPPRLLRLGVELADGRRATNLDGYRLGAGGEPRDPVLNSRGGGGGGTRWEGGFWLWPAPPPGPLSFVVEWPAQQIPLTRATIDAERIAAAAQRSEVLWPRARRGDHGGGRHGRLGP